MFLGEVASIKTGLVLTRKKAEVDFEEKAVYPLLTLKNIDDGGLFRDLEYELFSSNDELESHYFTKEGDVLIRLSYPYTTLYIGKEQEGLLIPSYFSVIDVDPEKFIPAYVAWYLNTEEVKKELGRSQSGSMMPATNQTALKSLRIPNADEKTQKKLIQLWNLNQQEKKLYIQLIKQREQQFKGVAELLLQQTSKEEE